VCLERVAEQREERSRDEKAEVAEGERPEVLDDVPCSYYREDEGDES
jgi:hypothetical protein